MIFFVVGQLGTQINIYYIQISLPNISFLFNISFFCMITLLIVKKKLVDILNASSYKIIKSSYFSSYDPGRLTQAWVSGFNPSDQTITSCYTTFIRI